MLPSNRLGIFFEYKSSDLALAEEALWEGSV